MPFTNAQRAQRARNALHAWQTASVTGENERTQTGEHAAEPDQEALTDLLVDLRHLAASERLSFDMALVSSQTLFQEELSEGDPRSPLEALWDLITDDDADFGEEPTDDPDIYLVRRTVTDATGYDALTLLADYPNIRAALKDGQPGEWLLSQADALKALQAGGHR